MNPLGVYVHFPYCRQRCPYCDFAIHVRRRIPHAEYAAAVLDELHLRAPRCAGRRLVSVYFGGGTPSLWEPACVGEVLAEICARLGGEARSLEVTLEANPDELSRAHLDALRAAGVNRLSLGVQSFASAQLVTLGRTHDAHTVRRAVAGARAAGFDNLSLDLIWGLPGQTPRDLDADLDALLQLAPEHLSAYQLTVEPHTPFAAYERRGTLRLPSDDHLIALGEQLAARLTDVGFEHYEVSSWALPGRRAVHNSLYWSGGEWLGLGCAAHSFLRGDDDRRDGRRGGGERWATVKNVDAWLRALRDGAELRATREHLDEHTLAREAMWLGLRQLADGVDRARFAARFGDDPATRFAAEVADLERSGLLEILPERLRLTPRGAQLADEVALRFL